MAALESLYSQVARKVLTESLGLRKGQALTVECWNNGIPFARQVVLEARRIGAIPLVIFEDEDAYVEGARVMPKDVLGQMGKQEFSLLSKTDAYVFIPGPVLGSYSHRMDRATYLESIRYNESWYKAASKAHLKGARFTFGYISDEAEKVLGKPAESIVSHQLRAALADYRAIGARGRDIASHLVSGAEVAIGTPRSRLKLTVKGGVEVEDGIVDETDLENESNVTYIPPGFVYAEVEAGSVSGSFSFSPTVTRFGMLSEGVAVFDHGELVKIASSASRSTLRKVLDASPSKTASAIAVGLNPLLKYGYGRNICCSGVIGVRALGVDFTAKSASLRVDGKRVSARP